MAAIPPTSLITSMEDIRSWMSRNFLKLNGNKTEALLIGSKFTLTNSQHSPAPPIIINGFPVPFSPQVKSLGVTLDNTLSFAPHIKNITWTAFFTSITSPDSAHHYPNPNPGSFVCHFPHRLLQCPPNRTPRQTHQQTANHPELSRPDCTKSSDHITPILIQLHWLPVQFHIHFKNLHKALHHLAPTYLCDLLHEYSTSRTLRSNSAGLLTIPTSRLSTMGAWAFSCSELWNSPPPHIKQSDSIATFKSKLKTHLFKLANSFWLVAVHCTWNLSYT